MKILMVPLLCGWENQSEVRAEYKLNYQIQIQIFIIQTNKNYTCNTNTLAGAFGGGERQSEVCSHRSIRPHPSAQVLRLDLDYFLQ